MNYRLSTLLVVAFAVLLGGCATSGPPAARIYTDYSEDAPVAGDAMANGAEFSVEDGPQAPQSDPSDLTQVGTGKLINETAARKPTSPEGATGEVTFNFEGESLHAVVKLILGEFLQQNYVIAPGVQGTVTFSTARPLRGDQALSILEMLLRWNNATLIWEDGRYTVLPVAQALPGNLTPRMGPAQTARGYEVRAVPLKFISATEMEKLLKPYARPESVVNVDPTRNLITLAGTRAELENYLQTIEVFDVDWLAGMSVGVFTLQQSDAAEVITEMEKIFGEGSNTPLAGLFRFVPLEGINGVLVITPQPNYLTTIEEWLERFDLGGGEAGQRLYVYEVKNVNALDLSDTLSDIFQTSGGRPSSSGGAGVAPGLEPVEIRTLGADGTQRSTAQDERKARTEERRAARAEANTGNTAAGGDGISLGSADEVRISAVEESNSLIVRASSSQWESIRRVIERLDQVPLQVVIETQIVRVALNESLSYGVQWFFENSIPEPLRAQAAGRNSFSDYAGSILPVGQNGGGLSWSFLGPSAQALISAIDSVSDLTILSAPSLVVLNNKQGTINVGTQIPVVSTFLSNPIGGGGTDPLGTSSVQFRQTGLTLSVTPRVNPGGLVFLEIEQEESEPGKGAPIGGNLAIDTRTIQTEVAVQSGNTVVLGGLIKQTDKVDSSGAPFLSRIPVLGALFGSKSNNMDREELIVLITPRVIRNADDARQITNEYQRRFRGLKPIVAPPADMEE